ncbi:hypothetical protein CRG98_011996 [Punica granatum]|uniref:Reverse transcriptase/retrotransposon-derived protein RNase H-like domain-containing protein n=1 Tax=Punica granatum TaxID=22663 RepID=A0A2I0KIJ0_PUNGR|nr:hypothetical protein CRG98_011996 [Punica granatum]
MAAEDTEEINLVNSVPHIPISVYISKCAKPIKVIAFLDTRAAQTIMNPEVLPKECWKPHTKHFSTASSEVFSTHLISRPLKIQFFPGCYLITRVLGSALPRKDIVIGWDIITKTPRFFMAQEDDVKQILSELQDLIEPSDAPWACEAFYVNKRSEQVRGKLRLVINYQPLNHFLQDDKFPLLNKHALFSSLQRLRCFQSLICRQAFGNSGSIQKTDPKLGSVSQMPIISGSPLEEAHILLLRRFSKIVQDYGIILSEKKMYQSKPHVAQELLKYPEESLTKKQIQQFLGTVNYLRDFLRKITKLTCPLEKMLKKDAPTWGPNQTKLDLNPPTANQAQSSPLAQQAAQASDQAGPSGTANLQNLDNWPQPVLPTQSHAREWWDDYLTIDDINWSLNKINDK